MNKIRQVSCRVFFLKLGSIGIWVLYKKFIKNRCFAGLGPVFLFKFGKMSS